MNVLTRNYLIILFFIHLSSWHHGPNGNHFAMLQRYLVLMSLWRSLDGFCCQTQFSLTLQVKHWTQGVLSAKRFLLGVASYAFGRFSVDKLLILYHETTQMNSVWLSKAAYTHLHITGKIFGTTKIPQQKNFILTLKK